MQSRKFWRSAKLLLTIPAAAFLMSSFAAPAQAEPPTTFRPATIDELTANTYPWDFGWIETQNPNGHEKLLATFVQNNFPWAQIATNVTNSKGEFFNTSDWILDPFQTGPGYIRNSRLQFVYVPERNAWHWTQQDPVSQVGVPGGSADLWITGWRTGAQYDTQWDSPEHVTWSSAIGTGWVNGWVDLPNQPREEVHNWAFEQERMSGAYFLAPRHKGYDYAQSMNPDGSSDILFIYNNIDGTKRGILSHTPAAGDPAHEQICEPTDIHLSDWLWENNARDRGNPVAPFTYPTKVEAQCSGSNPDGRFTLHYHYVSTETHLFPVKVGPSEWTIGASTMNSGYLADRPGSIATIQHYRNPAWAGSGIDWTKVQS